MVVAGGSDCTTVFIDLSNIYSLKSNGGNDHFCIFIL